MSVVEQIQKIADNEGVRITSLESEIGASKGVLSRAISKGTDIQSKWISKIVENYPKYNAAWILTGRGQMIVSNDGAIQTLSEPAQAYNLRTDVKEDIQRVPLYNNEAAASLISLFTDYTTEMQIGTISIPNLPKCDGAIHVTGDSMYPLLKSGDIVMFKKVPDPLTAILFFGEMYLLAFSINGDDYVAVKWIQRSKDDKHVKLVSENQHHQPIDIPRSSISALALIKASVRINSMN